MKKSRKVKLVVLKGRTRLELFKDLFAYWAKEFELDEIIVGKDNRYSAHLTTEYFSRGKVKVKCNARALARWSPALVICGVFHELVHIIVDLPYETEDEMVESEYQAERYALELMKLYYPSLVRDAIAYAKKQLSSYSWRKKNPIHYQAFSLIEDYK